MIFVSSAAAALEQIAREPVRVVVSDLDMPHMNGAQLFDRLRSEQPATIRILLSGNVDSASLAPIRPFLDAILAKPCDPDALRAAIEVAIENDDRAR
jgi:CheY-like chemotaxis protein